MIQWYVIRAKSGGLVSDGKKILFFEDAVKALEHIMFKCDNSPYLNVEKWYNSPKSD